MTSKVRMGSIKSQRGGVRCRRVKPVHRHLRTAMRARNLLLLSALALTAALPATASAQGEASIGKARTLYENANFEEALDMLASVADADTLSRYDLTELLFLRATVNFALGRNDEVEHELHRLVAVDPSYVPDQGIPPRLRSQLDKIRKKQRQVSMELSLKQKPGAVRIVAQMKDNPKGLAQQVAVFARVGSGQWRASEGGSIELPASEGATVQYYGYIRGPGNATIARVGSRQHPRSSALTGAGPDQQRLVQVMEPVDEGRSGKSAKVWWLVGAGVAAGVAAIVVVALTSQSTSERVEVLPPTVPAGAPRP